MWFRIFPFYLLRVEHYFALPLPYLNKIKDGDHLNGRSVKMGDAYFDAFFSHLVNNHADKQKMLDTLLLRYSYGSCG